MRGAHFVRRRCSLLLAGWLVARSASYPRNRRHHKPFPGGAVPHAYRNTSPAGDTLRATIPSACLPGVAPAPRLQPPANHRERLRRTSPTRSARSCLRPYWLATHPGLRCTPNALRAFLPPPTLAYHPHRWPPADTGHLPCPSATPLATCGNRTWHAVAIARRAFRAPEALSFGSRGLQPRSGCYPR